jgi:hypothetical protein
MAEETGAQRQARFYRRRLRAGLVLVKAWVRRADASEVRELIRPYRERAEADVKDEPDA